MESEIYSIKHLPSSNDEAPRGTTILNALNRLPLDKPTSTKPPEEAPPQNARIEVKPQSSSRLGGLTQDAPNPLSNLVCANKNFENNINFKIIYGDVFREKADVVALSLDNIFGFGNPFLQRISSKRKQLIQKITAQADHGRLVRYRDETFGFVDYRTGSIHQQRRFVVCNFPRNLGGPEIESVKILLEKMLKSLLDDDEHFSICILPFNHFQFSFRLERIAEVIIEFISQYDFPSEIKRRFKKQQNLNQNQAMDFLEDSSSGESDSESESEDDAELESADSQQMTSGEDSSFLESELALADIVMKQIKVVCPYKAQVGFGVTLGQDFLFQVLRNRHYQTQNLIQKNRLVLDPSPRGTRRVAGQWFPLTSAMRV